MKNDKNEKWKMIKMKNEKIERIKLFTASNKNKNRNKNIILIETSLPNSDSLASISKASVHVRRWKNEQFQIQEKEKNR
jgi:hypothetical protein